ncbi:MAG: DUF3842 family protein [Lachnospiraceae bacterium]|nr:DUF3842 family protein [Lachnospiraceae bacterium]
MKIMIMDGQGGGVGRLLIESISAALPEAEIIAVGTNATATANMMKGGTTLGATGENAVVYNSARVDAICGPVGILMANAMLGEISPKMAEAVSGADVPIFLIPMAKCNAKVMGVSEKKLTDYVKECTEKIKALLG